MRNVLALFSSVPVPFSVKAQLGMPGMAAAPPTVTGTVAPSTSCPDAVPEIVT
jgi:hypothetical protein